MRVAKTEKRRPRARPVLAMLAPAYARDPHWVSEAAMALGVAPFGLAALALADPLARGLALAVFVNGTVCHLAVGARKSFARAALIWDVACNVAMVALVNCVTQHQPATLAFSALATAAFWENRRQQCLWTKAVVHVTCVQWVLLLPLLRFGLG